MNAVLETWTPPVGDRSGLWADEKVGKALTRRLFFATHENSTIFFMIEGVERILELAPKAAYDSWESSYERSKYAR